MSDRPVILMVAALLCAATQASAQDDYFACSSCHGDSGEGIAAKSAPAIAGLDAAYIRKQMKAFKTGLRGQKQGDRHGVEMALIAAAYDDEAIERLSILIASMPNDSGDAGDHVSGDFRRGRTLFAQCAVCHGANAEGSPAMGAPRLTNQSGAYMLRQLANYRDGLRGYHPEDASGASMGEVVRAGLTGPTDFEDLIAFVDSLPH